MAKYITDFAVELMNDAWYQHRTHYKEREDWLQRFMNGDALASKGYCIGELETWFTEELDGSEMVSNKYLQTAVVDSVDYNTLYNVLESFFEEYQEDSKRDSESDEESDDDSDDD